MSGMNVPRHDNEFLFFTALYYMGAEEMSIMCWVERLAGFLMMYYL